MIDYGFFRFILWLINFQSTRFSLEKASVTFINKKNNILYNFDFIFFFQVADNKFCF